MIRRRCTVFLAPAVEQALVDYTHRHRAHFPTLSQAAEHLLARALAGNLGEGTEELLAPALIAAVRETTRREIADGIGVLLERQSHRLATLLVQSGNDAYRAARVAEVALGHLFADPARAARIAAEARLEAGARYRVQSRTTAEPPSVPPPGSAGRPPGARE